MSDDPTCPYCNARLSPAPGGKAPCPRCGEMVSVPDAAGFTATPPRAIEAAPYRKPVEANRRTAAVVLATMAVLAATGLTYALMTVDGRRTNDKGLTRSTRRPILPPLSSPPEVTPAAPGRLAGLAFMPPGTTFAAGLHAAELLQGPLGTRLRAEPLKVAGLEFSLDSAEQWLGIPAGNIEYIVVGSVLESGGEVNRTPRTVVVIRTLNPVGITRLREALGAKPAKQRGGRPVSEGSIAGAPITLWVPTAYTVVIGIVIDLADLPPRPADGLERLVAELHPVLEKHLGAGTAAWAVGHSSAWNKSPLLKMLPLGKMFSLDDLTGVRTLGAWLPSDEPYRALAAVGCADETTAKRIEAAIKKRADPRLKSGRDGAWLSVQLSLP